MRYGIPCLIACRATSSTAKIARIVRARRPDRFRPSRGGSRRRGARGRLRRGLRRRQARTCRSGRHSRARRQGGSIDAVSFTSRCRLGRAATSISQRSRRVPAAASHRDATPRESPGASRRGGRDDRLPPDRRRMQMPAHLEEAEDAELERAFASTGCERSTAFDEPELKVEVMELDESGFPQSTGRFEATQSGHGHPRPRGAGERHRVSPVAAGCRGRTRRRREGLTHVRDRLPRRASSPVATWCRA